MLQCCTPLSVLDDHVSILPTNKCWKIIDSVKTLLACFFQFFERGTLSQCCELLLKHFKPQDILTHIQSLLPPGASHVTLTQPPDAAKPAKPRKQPTGEEVFFKPRIQDQKRLERVTRVAWESVVTRINENYDEPIVSKDFTSKSPITQLKELYLMTQPVQKRATITDRIYLLYFRNAVENYAASDLELQQHRSGISTAFDHIADKQGIKRKDVVDVYSQAYQYLKLAERGGLGIMCWVQGSKSE